jgi:uncharacterized protein (DUF433 family)
MPWEPVVTGTPTPVSVILGHFAACDSLDEICRQYDITADDIRACVAFVKQVLSQTTFRDLKPLRPAETP